MMLRRPWRQSMVFGTRMTRFESPGRLISVSLAMMMGAPASDDRQRVRMEETPSRTYLFVR